MSVKVTVKGKGKGGKRQGTGKVKCKDSVWCQGKGKCIGTSTIKGKSKRDDNATAISKVAR